VEDARGKPFTYLASDDETPLSSAAAAKQQQAQRNNNSKGIGGAAGGKRASGRMTAAERKEAAEVAAAIAAVEAAARTANTAAGRAAAKRGRHSAAASSAAAAAAEAASASAEPAVSASPALVEPVVIGHRWNVDWSRSSAPSAAALEGLLKELNRKEAAGTDITDAEHNVTLHISRRDKYNVSDEEKQAYDIQIAAQNAAAAAARNSKRKRWLEGAPDEEWQLDNPAKQGDAAAASKYSQRGANGVYVYTTKVSGVELHFVTMLRAFASVKKNCCSLIPFCVLSCAVQYVHEDWCHLCKLGGDLLCCGYCPRVYHQECVGLSRAPGGYFSCPQHKCATCERNSQEAGGMLFRCVVCPCAYCEDDVPTEYEGRKDLDRCFELEQTGYSQPSSAFFITCSQSCTQYYEDYLAGKNSHRRA
jgi:hypothetical protein